MLVILSPAKSLDFDSPGIERFSQPRHLEQAEVLVETMRKKSPGDLQKLMSISDTLAELNVERFREFTTPFDRDNAKQSILAFTGDTYKDMGLEDWDDDDFAFAQDHVRILSGLY